MLIAIMHCVPDEDDPYRIVARLMEAVPAGSFLSHPAVAPPSEVEAKSPASVWGGVARRTR
jgi:hypothetical protein